MVRRLTKKTINGYVPQYERETKHNYYDLVSKLGKLEDIEEELGIDLKIIFKALKQGYIETRVCKLTNIVLAYDEYIKNWCFYEIDEGGYGKGWLLEDYGKSWATTKEELEN